MQPLPFEFDPQLICRLDRNGPRYTSYPTADRFTAAFGPDQYRSWAAKHTTTGARHALSIYVHLPFCRTLCFYCACNKIATKNSGKAKQYLDYLHREITMQGELFGRQHGHHRVTQMHWGGGTPTFYEASELSRLFDQLRATYDFADDGEFSIEVDPRTVDASGIAALRGMGFNRISLGVQDFDPEVQRAVNRVQSEAQTLAVMEAARHEGFSSINVDLIYGLPKQNPLTFSHTLDRVIAANPGRVAVYNYAHLPSRFTSQRRILERDIPAPEIKLQLLSLAVEKLRAAGYVYIGMDHFAREDDALAVAQREGYLQRNFQGYSTHAGSDLLALGVSSIGQIGPTYSQNHRSLDDYYQSIDGGQLPVARGIVLTADDLLRRTVIQRLMCDFALSIRSLEKLYLIDFKEYFNNELPALEELAHTGLLKLDEQSITVTAKGRMLVRNICMVFDAYLRQLQSLDKFSRVI